MLKLKIKKLNDNAVIPFYSRLGDAGLDLTATSVSFDNKGGFSYGTGIAVEIPENFAGLILPRSSLSKYDLVLSNHVGLIDSNYRGELILKFKSTKPFPNIYTLGDRIGQLLIIPYPIVAITEVDELSESNRGNKGFGSSGT